MPIRVSLAGKNSQEGMTSGIGKRSMTSDKTSLLNLFRKSKPPQVADICTAPTKSATLSSPKFTAVKISVRRVRFRDPLTEIINPLEGTKTQRHRETDTSPSDFFVDADDYLPQTNWFKKDDGSYVDFVFCGSSLNHISCLFV